MTLYEINEASSLIQSEAHEDANIIFGTVVDETMGDEIRITVIATGFENADMPRSNVTPLGSLRRSNLAVPTFIRNEKPADACMPGRPRGGIPIWRSTFLGVRRTRRLRKIPMLDDRLIASSGGMRGRLSRRIARLPGRKA